MATNQDRKEMLAIEITQLRQRLEDAMREEKEAQANIDQVYARLDKLPKDAHKATVVEAARRRDEAVVIRRDIEATLRIEIQQYDALRNSTG